MKKYVNGVRIQTELNVFNEEFFVVNIFICRCVLIYLNIIIIIIYIL